METTLCPLKNVAIQFLKQKKKKLYGQIFFKGFFKQIQKRGFHFHN